LDSRVSGKRSERKRTDMDSVTGRAGQDCGQRTGMGQERLVLPGRMSDGKGGYRHPFGGWSLAQNADGLDLDVQRCQVQNGRGAAASTAGRPWTEPRALYIVEVQYLGP
ncbi:hypothetical protein KCU88_g322, partial [Aureobasidium melanogenum]